ncbi:MAG: glycosyltransferase family 9 protein, partial [Vicinamibacterales bacterium]|nr:glycosyltransferase family 9 protein [Vicinamibacterales bacterium]
MGLGGHLLWSSVFRTLSETTRRPVRVSSAPLVSDLFAGRLYRGDSSWADNPIFRHNPRLDFPPRRLKRRWQNVLDRVVATVLRRCRLWGSYERAIVALSRIWYRATGRHVVHVDLRLHSYVKRETPGRFEWKSGGHIIDIILNRYRIPAIDHRCEMYFTDDEVAESVEACRAHGITGEYIVIEPNSSETWFSDLRTWPVERWQHIVDRIQASRGYQVVQIGEAGRPALRNVINLSGEIPFRIAVLIMKRARVFLGLEGGLMHAANAVGVPSVIVWGGTTMPDFAAYREKHCVVCHYVECAP